MALETGETRKETLQPVKKHSTICLHDKIWGSIETSARASRSELVDSPNVLSSLGLIAAIVGEHTSAPLEPSDHGRVGAN